MDVLSTSAEKGQLSLVASKGSLEQAYQVLILASTAAVMDREVEVFCTFSGLNLLKKDLSSMKMSLVGRSDLPFYAWRGPVWFQKINWMKYLPGLVWMLPGAEALATYLFKQKLKHHNQLDLNELRSLCLELGVKFVACQMTVELLTYNIQDFIPEVEFAGAATYFAQSPTSQSLFI